MGNWSIRMDLKRCNGAFATNIKGKNATKKCVCIPIDDNEIFVGGKGIYIDMTAVEKKQETFGETHFLRLQVGKEKYEKMSEEERKEIPILGGMHEIKYEPKQSDVTTTTEVENCDDLPF